MSPNFLSPKPDRQGFYLYIRKKEERDNIKQIFGLLRPIDKGDSKSESLLYVPDFDIKKVSFADKIFSNRRIKLHTPLLRHRHEVR